MGNFSLTLLRSQQETQKCTVGVCVHRSWDPCLPANLEIPAHCLDELVVDVESWTDCYERSSGSQDPESTVPACSDTGFQYPPLPAKYIRPCFLILATLVASPYTPYMAYTIGGASHQYRVKSKSYRDRVKHLDDIAVGFESQQRRILVVLDWLFRTRVVREYTTFILTPR